MRESDWQSQLRPHTPTMLGAPLTSDTARRHAGQPPTAPKGGGCPFQFASYGYGGLGERSDVTMWEVWAAIEAWLIAEAAWLAPLGTIVAAFAYFKWPFKRDKPTELGEETISKIAPQPKDRTTLAVPEFIRIIRDLKDDLEALLDRSGNEIGGDRINASKPALEKGDLSIAEGLYREALEIDRATIGEVHPAYATDLNNLVLLLIKMERAEEAEPMSRQVLAIRGATLPTDHPDIAPLKIFSNKRFPR